MAICLTADIVVFTFTDAVLKVLLVRRKKPPHQGRMALPGGFVSEKEPLEKAALRELKEETGLRLVAAEQLGSFGDPRRDPRGRIVSVAHLALVAAAPAPRAGSNASQAAWLPVKRLPPLAFDHKHIISSALERLRDKLDYSTAGF